MITTTIVLLIYSLFTGTAVRKFPWLRTAIPAYARGAKAMAKVKAIQTKRLAGYLTRRLVIGGLIYLGFLIFALLFNFPPLLAVIAMVGLVPSFLLMVALNVARTPVAFSGYWLEDFSKKAWKKIPVIWKLPPSVEPKAPEKVLDFFTLLFWRLPASAFVLTLNGLALSVLLPIKIATGSIVVLAEMVKLVEIGLLLLTRALAAVNILLTTLFVFAVLDWIHETDLSDPRVIAAGLVIFMVMVIVSMFGVDRVARRVQKWAAKRKAGEGSPAPVAAHDKPKEQLKWSLWLWRVAMIGMAAWFIFGIVAPGYALPIAIRGQESSLAIQEWLWPEPKYYFIKFTDEKPYFVSANGQILNPGSFSPGETAVAMEERTTGPDTGAVWDKVLHVYPVKTARPEELLKERLPKPTKAPFIIADGKGYQRVGVPSAAPSTTTTAGAGTPTPKPKEPAGHFRLEPNTEFLIQTPDRAFRIYAGEQILFDTHAPTGALLGEIDGEKFKIKHGRMVVRVRKEGVLKLKNHSTEVQRLTIYLYAPQEVVPEATEPPHAPMITHVLENHGQVSFVVYWEEPSGVEFEYNTVGPGELVPFECPVGTTMVIRQGNKNGPIMDRIERATEGVTRIYKPKIS